MLNTHRCQYIKSICRQVVVPVVFLMCLFIGIPSSAFGWSKSGAVYTTDGSYSDVASAVSDASTDDTITIPSGTYNWGSNTLTISKRIILQGAGKTSTIITHTTGTMISINNANASGGLRITGFKINKTSGFTISLTAVATDFRFDHLHFNYSNSDEGIYINWPSKTIHLQGLVDNCIFDHANSYIVGVQHDRYGFTIMSDDTDFGGETALYYEDNVAHQWDAGGIEPNNFVDLCCGLSVVSRYNEIYGYYHETHGLQGNYNLRGTKKIEIYRNTLHGGFEAGDNYERQTQVVNLRIAAAMIWQNDVSYYSSHNGLWDISEYRLFQPEGDIGQCDGNSQADSNYEANGWLCLDQPGAGPDKSTRTAGNPSPDQYQEPIYIWGNSAGNAVDNSTPAYFKADRDYFVQGGTVGISTGASAPTGSCTEGEGYWCTGCGDWNKDTDDPTWGGVQGVLYQCSITGYTGDGDSGTWAVHYTPYEYPHPLRSGTMRPPENLRIVR